MRRIFGLSIGALLLLGLLTYCNGGSGEAQLPAVKDSPQTVEQSGPVDPIASAQAVRGGSFTVWSSAFPKTLNYWTDPNGTSAGIHSMLFNTLLTMHSTSDAPVGDLAQSWRRTGDAFIFKLHPKAVWSDGRPITAADVQFYYDTIVKKEHLTTVPRVSVRRFHRPEIIDARTVRIRIKIKHWKNFWDAGSMQAFPKHIWQGKDFNKVNFDFPVVSGPYKILTVKKNRYVLLKRRGDWWGRTLRFNQGKYNFDYLRYRFAGDRVKALQLFKKGLFDSYPIYTARIWAKQLDFEAVRKNWVVKQTVHNQEPVGFQGFAINLRRKRFQDVRVRKALCHLLNRKQLNDKFMFNAYFLLNSYFPSAYPSKKHPTRPLCRYNPVLARKLLEQAGWKVARGGKLMKDGKQFHVTFVTFMHDLRHLQLYVGDLKAVGIDARIDQTTRATLRRRLDVFDFDLLWSAWGAGRLPDPEPLWHSRGADQKGSANYPGVKDPQVDRILEQYKRAGSVGEQRRLLRKLDDRLAALRPNVLLWQLAYTRMLYWNKFGQPKYVLGKYGREDDAIVYWWFDKEKARRLQEARRKKTALPAERARVDYRGP